MSIINLFVWERVMIFSSLSRSLLGVHIHKFIPFEPFKHSVQPKLFDRTVMEMCFCKKATLNF